MMADTLSSIAETPTVKNEPIVVLFLSKKESGREKERKSRKQCQIPLWRSCADAGVRTTNSMAKNQVWLQRIMLHGVLDVTFLWFST